jgi:hypothetical protein
MAMIATTMIGFMATSMIAPQQAYTLFHRPKQGEVADYSIRLLVANESLDVKISSEVKGTCLKVHEDGSWEMESKMVSGSISVNGAERPLDLSPPVTFKYDKFGKTAKDDSENKPITNIITLAYGFEPKSPVKLDDSWKSESDYGPMTVRLDSKIKQESKDLLKLIISGKVEKLMTPGSASGGAVKGTILVDENDASLQFAEFEIKDTVFQPNQPAGTIRFTITRKKKTS